MRSTPISPSLFSRNRKKFGKLLPEGAMAIICSNPRMLRNGDQYFPYRQHSGFYYLTGIGQEGSVFVYGPEMETLFIRKPDPKTILWSGPLLTTGQASSLSGIKDVRWLDELDKSLMKNAKESVSLFLNHEIKQDPSSLMLTPAADIYRKLERVYPRREYSSAEPLLMQLRMSKEPEEIEEIRKACGITRNAFLKVAGLLKPGMREYEIESFLSSEIIRAGARGHAFEPIVASGRNALTLHYVVNSGTCRSGDLLLMDFGAEVNNYAADCTRTLPVSGRFSKRQREIYDAVYRVFLRARALMLAGEKISDYHNKVGLLWEEEHIGLGLYSRADVENQPETDPLWKKYFVHGTSHSLGLDVHDPFDRSEPFRPGMVLTCEPAIYIPEEGIGIRLENDILITEGDPVDLMEDIPMEAGEIEKLMNLSSK